MNCQDNNLEVEKSLHKQYYSKIQQKSIPSEALGLYTYTNEAINDILKIREAWLPKLEIIVSHPPLARLPANA